MEKIKPVLGVSDHDIVFVQASTTAPRSKTPKRTILLLKNADLDSIRSNIKQFLDYYLSKHITYTKVNTIWNEFKNICCDIIEKDVPSKLSTQRFNHPWITRKIKCLSRRKKRALRRARHTYRNQKTSLDTRSYRRPPNVSAGKSTTPILGPPCLRIATPRSCIPSSSPEDVTALWHRPPKK